MDENYEYRKHRTFRSLLLIFAAIFLNKGILYAIIDDLTEPGWLPGTTEFGIGIVMATYLGTIVISTLLFGYYGEKLSEKYSRKKVFTITQLGWIICYGLLPFSLNYYFFLILTGVAAFFVGSFIPIAFTMVGEFYPPEQRGKQYGWLNFGLIIGLGGGMIFASIFSLFGSIGWRLAYGLGAILGLASVLGYFASGIEPERGREEPDFQDLKEIKYDYKITLGKLKRLFKNKTIAALMISLLIQGIAIEAVGAWSIYYFEEQKLLALGAYAGLFALLFYVIAGIGALPGNLIGGKVGDNYYNAGKLKGRVLISLGGLIVGLGCIFGFYLIPFWSYSILAIVLSSILILGMGFVGYLFLGFPAGNHFAIYSEVCVPEVRSTANAMHGMMVSLGGVFGNILLPALITVDISFYALAISICLLIQLVGALFWIIPYFTYPREAKECREILGERRKEMEKQFNN